MGTLRELKNALKKDEELRGLMVRSDRREILLDLDGDQIPDIGLLDTEKTGDINAIAIDLTGNGEFNFYLIDHDGNGVPDEISFYRDGDDIPAKAHFGRSVEADMLESVGKIHALITASNIVTSEITSALRRFEDFVIEAYRDGSSDGVEIVSE